MGTLTRGGGNEDLPSDREVLGAFKKGKWGICWIRVMEERLLCCDITGRLSSSNVGPEHAVRYLVGGKNK